jgi:hypothetical protein
MTEIAEKFDIEVDNEIYTVTRVLDERNEKVATYGFTTIVDGKEHKLRATLTSEVIGDIAAQNGINVIKELADVLLTEFRLEIAKVKETAR